MHKFALCCIDKTGFGIVNQCSYALLLWKIGGFFVKASEIRRKYVEFFREKGHEIVPSASLVPKDDASLLWINSGMAPLKRYFDGRIVPTNPRLTNSQKCIRTNDIENVGKTARHHTFFEMLGNFSIGDYFKREAIHWAWEFVTQRLLIDPAKLSITIHPEDDEAYNIWHKEIGIPDNKILRLEDNFWDIGEGPCGPNSEIFFDRGPTIGCGRKECDASCDCDRHLEIWNLVFSQYNHNPDGSYTPLPKKNIDTGMGLERTASVLQGVNTNYATDLFQPIISAAAAMLHIRYGEKEDSDVALKVISDHVRAVVFAIADGVLPSNEGRGYVIRRLLRRAVRHGKQQGMSQPYLYRLVGIVADVMNDYYPELLEKRSFIETVIKTEEERFFETLTDGEALLAKAIARVLEQGKTVLDGAQVFKLYDTYGFPADLTEEIVAQSGLAIDRDGFTQALEKQRERARNARQDADSMQVQTTVLRDLAVVSEFVGYDVQSVDARISAIIDGDKAVSQAHLGDLVQVVLDRTPFYAESGGQVADQGVVFGEDFELRVIDVQKGPNGQNVHHCEVTSGTPAVGSSVTASIDAVRRFAIAKNHTATHLMHKALRDVLGMHVAQAGSLVQDERLRFDFSHIGAMTQEQMEKVERYVNEQIWRDTAVTIEQMPLQSAKELGAMALFGEKYGEIVRVVKVGAYSTELCGGCHVERTGKIGLFKLVSETGIGSGVRRIEAVTGRFAYDYVLAQEKLLAIVADKLHANPLQLQNRLEGVLDHVKDLERQMDRLTDNVSRLESGQLLSQVEQFEHGQMLVAQVAAMDVEGLRSLADQLRQKQPDLGIVLGSVKEGKVSFVSVVPKSWQEKGAHAGKLIKSVAEVAGGSGGGRPDMAQAGAKHADKLKEALDVARTILKEGFLLSISNSSQKA